METSNWIELFAKTAGLGGLGLFVFLILFRELIKKNIFSVLNPKQTFRTITIFMLLTFLVFASGLVAWVYISAWRKPGNTFPSIRTDPEKGPDYKRVFYEGFDSQDPSDQRKDSLDIWLIGKRGDWLGTNSDGRYILTSVNEAGVSFGNRIQYLVKDEKIDLTESKVSVMVKVVKGFSPYSGAGLKYRCTDQNAFYGFILHSGNTVALLIQQENKVDILWSGEIRGPVGQAVQLKITSHADSLHLYVNGDLIHTHTGAESLEGDPGIFAMERGSYEFDDFSIFIPAEEDLDKSRSQGL